MEPANPDFSLNEAFSDPGVDLFIGGFPRLLIDDQVVEVNFVEFLGKFDESCIPTFLYVPDNFLDRSANFIQTGCPPRNPGFDIYRAPHNRKNRRERLLKFRYPGKFRDFMPQTTSELPYDEGRVSFPKPAFAHAKT